MRAVARCRCRLGGDIPDLVLAFFHARQVISQRYSLASGIVMRTGKTQQLGDAITVTEIFAHTLFENDTEFAPELGVFLRLVCHQFIQQAQYAPHTTRAYRFDILALLQDLA